MGGIAGVAVVPLKTVEKVGLTPAVRIAREYTSTRTEKETSGSHPLIIAEEVAPKN